LFVQKSESYLHLLAAMSTEMQLQPNVVLLIQHQHQMALTNHSGDLRLENKKLDQVKEIGPLNVVIAKTHLRVPILELRLT
jgi:hypothetical protein